MDHELKRPLARLAVAFDGVLDCCDDCTSSARAGPATRIEVGASSADDVGVGRDAPDGPAARNDLATLKLDVSAVAAFASLSCLCLSFVLQKCLFTNWPTSIRHTALRQSIHWASDKKTLI